MDPRKMKKKSTVTLLCYVVSHPIQYQAPLLKLIAQDASISLDVFFTEKFAAQGNYDPGFKQEVKWDTPLLEGYRHHFLGRKNKGRLLWQILLKKYNVVWLHGYSSPYYFLLILLANLSGVKVLVRGETCEKYKEEGLLKRCFRPFLFKLLSRMVDGFLAIGTLNKKFYLAQGIPEKKIFDAPYTVHNAYFQNKISQGDSKVFALRQQLQLEAGRDVILFASKFLPRKRAIDVLKAYLNFIAARPESEHPYLVFVGDGQEREIVEKEAQQAKASRVIFLGFKNQAELPYFFRLCNVFVLPSFRENWGLIVNEVMNAARPVIVSSEVGCVPDLVKHGVNGYVYQAGNVDELTQCLVNLVGNSALQGKMGKASIEQINCWDLEHTKRGLLAACEAVCS